MEFFFALQFVIACKALAVEHITSVPRAERMGKHRRTPLPVDCSSLQTVVALRFFPSLCWFLIQANNIFFLPLSVASVLHSPLGALSVKALFKVQIYFMV